MGIIPSHRAANCCILLLHPCILVLWPLLCIFKRNNCNELGFWVKTSLQQSSREFRVHTGIKVSICDSLVMELYSFSNKQLGASYFYAMGELIQITFFTIKTSGNFPSLVWSSHYSMLKSLSTEKNIHKVEQEYHLNYVEISRHWASLLYLS